MILKNYITRIYPMIFVCQIIKWFVRISRVFDRIIVLIVIVKLLSFYHSLYFKFPVSCCKSIKNIQNKNPNKNLIQN